ncbi:PGN_0703 family putative restriction endonuclease [Sphingobium limneticum]
MMIRPPLFLPGVPEDLIRAALGKAGGNEIDSGKLDSPESSAALAVNGFGWFVERPADLPAFPSLADLDWPALKVDVERQMRFPWSGGRHPWLDAAVETPTHVIGVESKRFEPFRDAKTVSLSPAYDRDVWGEQMIPFTKMRDRLRSGQAPYAHLDGTQLVKHAFGLVTEGRRLGKIPVLLYLYAEPAQRGSVAISPATIARHRADIADFAAAVAGAEVRFAACSWRDWLAGWTGDARAHADALTARFQP